MNNMYEFAKPWNPLGGKCPHNCSYCSSKKIMKRNLPYFNKKYSGELRLIYTQSGMKKNLGSGNFWFVCAQMDLFVEGVTNKMIIEVLEYCNKYLHNTFFFQSKNTERFFGFRKLFPENTILCTTFETNRIKLLKKYSGGIKNLGRIYDLYYMDFPFHITLEPLMDFDIDKMIEPIEFLNPIQVNIGGNSNPNIKLPEPPKEKILELISKLEKFTKVYQKPNLRRLLK